MSFPAYVAQYPVADPPTVAHRGTESKKILSEAAKALIHQYLIGSTHEDEDAVEPPFMRPSSNPDDYSYVSVLTYPPPKSS